MIEPLLPMLATVAAPFDSGAYVFEVKWDGVRALAAVEGTCWRLWGRELTDYTGRYPELAMLRRLPSGTVVDGELVMFQDGRADLNAILSRHQMTHSDWISHASRQKPVRFVLFDILYHQGRSLLQESLSQRRSVLAELLTEIDAPELMFSEGTVEFGRRFFERTVAAGHEGVMAKHQNSRYLPGRRSAAWKKIKPTEVLPCVIIGYTPRREGIHSLLVASVHQGALRYVAQVTSGFNDRMKTDLERRLAGRRRSRPVVACPHQALWVEPDLYCRVRFQQWTPGGRLRGASFAGLLHDEKT
jgi:bifunctional non-homologous end joining protein LigD